MGGKVQPPTRKHFSAGCQRWLVCFKSDGLDDGTRGGRLVASGNRGVRVGAVVEMNTPLKLILVLGMFKMMIMFFLKQRRLPP